MCATECVPMQGAFQACSATLLNLWGRASLSMSIASDPYRNAEGSQGRVYTRARRPLKTSGYRCPEVHAVLALTVDIPLSPGPFFNPTWSLLTAGAGGIRCSISWLGHPWAAIRCELRLPQQSGGVHPQGGAHGAPGCCRTCFLLLHTATGE